jgi:hypothetical protein
MFVDDGAADGAILIFEGAAVTGVEEFMSSVG